MLDAISILLALAIGFLLVQVLDPVPNMQPGWAVALFRAALGTGVGIGLTSVVFLLLDVSGVAAPATIFGADFILLALLAWLWFRTRGANRTASSSNGPALGFRWTWLLALAFGAVLTISLVRLIQIATALPVGDWDAWALWNLRAKFLAGPGGAWRYALSPLIAKNHPDYPLLLSAFIARSWKAGGNMDAIAPVVTSLLFFAALIALLVSAVALLRGTAAALLAGLVILSTTSLLVWAPSQYADIPLGFYYLSAVALVFIDAARTDAGRWPLLWAGICASFAAWTKNEGIVFMVTIPAVFLIVSLWRRGIETAWDRARWLLAGVIPGVLLTLGFRFFLAPVSDPLVTQGASGLTHLLDVNRYAQLAGGFFANLLTLGSGVTHPLILLAILAILVRFQIEERYRVPTLVTTVALGLVFLSYCAALLITPYTLTWQVQTSFDRLILQVWPGALLVFFAQLRSVANPAPSPVPVKNAAARKPPVRSKPATAGSKGR
jgi:hypothetical protein